MPSTNHHDDWEKQYWASQPEPKPGTREHLEKYGGPSLPHVIGFIVVIILFGFVIFAFKHVLNLPTVYESYLSGYCVKVEDPASQYSCENLPTKYYHVWVE